MNKQTVLIAEDKDEFRKIYGDRIRFANLNVVDAADGVQALEILKAQRIDLIVTDINMPNKDGYQLIAEVKADEKLKQIPIIVMSVFDSSEHLKKAMDLGASDYLIKGMTTPNAVVEKVKSLILPVQA